MALVSFPRLCSFYHTRKNMDRLMHRVFEHEALSHETDINNTPMEQAHRRSKGESLLCCDAPTMSLGCVVGSSCELIGSGLDFTCNLLTLGKVNAQKASDFYCADADCEGSGIFQRYLGVSGNFLGNCLGGILGGPLCIAAYIVTLPPNCCSYYCSSPSFPEKKPLMPHEPPRQKMV